MAWEWEGAGKIGEVKVRDVGFQHGVTWGGRGD